MSVIELAGPLGSNQYKNLRLLKRGGMGEVWVAEDSQSSQEVAIKIVPIQDAGLLGLLTEEGKIALLLKHGNIVQTFYAGTFQDGPLSNFYMAMELASSGSLADMLRSRTTPHSIAEALVYMTQIASGMSEAHKFIVHRDLKPDNILVDKAGQLKISDFGLAKYISAATRTKSFKGGGTYPYMSPECWLFDTNTPAMDVYSLGIIFFQLLTGKLPYSATTENEWRHRHLYDPLPDIRTFRKDVPDRLVDCIAKMANKRAVERYPSASEVLKVLEDIVAAQKSSTPPKDPLVAQAIGVVHNHQAQALDLKRQQDHVDQETRLREASINGLFSLFEKRVTLVNAQLEQKKIQLSVKPGQWLRAEFLGNSLAISFFDQSGISKYMSERRSNSLENQRRQWGMVMQDIDKSIFEKEGIARIGTLGSSKPPNYAANLLLRRISPEDIYGEWWLAWFEDSALLAKSNLNHHYALREREFYREYEICRHGGTHVRSVTVKKLEEPDIEDYLSKILS